MVGSFRSVSSITIVVTGTPSALQHKQPMESSRTPNLMASPALAAHPLNILTLRNLCITSTCYQVVHDSSAYVVVHQK